MPARHPLKIVPRDPNKLLRRDRNPRIHPRRQIQQIAASIKEFGFVSPVLVDGADGIIAGHGRVEAAKLLRMRNIPTLCVEHLTPAQIRAYDAILKRFENVYGIAAVRSQSNKGSTMWWTIAGDKPWPS